MKMAKLKNLIGQKFGNLTVIERVDNYPHGQAKWKCVCDCGRETYAPTGALVSGQKKSCGCMYRKDYTGMRFGKLTAKYPVFHKGHRAWYCDCDCGGSTVVFTSNLTRGNSRACPECSKRNVLKTHGRYKHPCYRSWRGMRQRCLNSNSSDYPRYGGRGITICKEWGDIERFIADMGLPPSDKHTIDRIDPDKGYCPENCRWATSKLQSRNRRNSLAIEGVNLKEWCETNNFDYDRARRRLAHGQTADEILSTYIQVHIYKKGQTCNVEGCMHPVKSRGMCNKHYLRWWHGQKTGGDI